MIHQKNSCCTQHGLCLYPNSSIVHLEGGGYSDPPGSHLQLDRYTSSSLDNGNDDVNNFDCYSSGPKTSTLRFAWGPGLILNTFCLAFCNAPRRTAGDTPAPWCQCVARLILFTTYANRTCVCVHKCVYIYVIIYESLLAIQNILVRLFAADSMKTNPNNQIVYHVSDKLPICLKQHTLWLTICATIESRIWLTVW